MIEKHNTILIEKQRKEAKLKNDKLNLKWDN